MDRLETQLVANPELVAELYRCASEIVDDFDDYGPVLQANEDGEYGDSTAIERLRAVRDELKGQMSVMRGQDLR